MTGVDVDDRGGQDVIAAIGNTELRRLSSLPDDAMAQILAKCEFRNPTGSHKDRVFHHMIDALEKAGEIKPGMCLVECSTGNGGAALAQVGIARGYEVVVIMPAGMTMERKMQIEAFGAEILETDPEGFLDASEDAARSYVIGHPGSYFLDQSTSELNRQAWRACGHEIVQQCRALGVRPGAFVCSIGTGGTFSGIAEVLREAFPEIRTFAIEVDKSAPLFAKRHGVEFVHHRHNLMGLGPGRIPPNVREDLIDEVRTVSGDEGWLMMKRLISDEKLFTGPTAGSNVHIALQVAAELGPEQTVLTVLFDSAWKYFSVWGGDYPEYSEAATTAVTG
jgi:cysteine synthase